MSTHRRHKAKGRVKTSAGAATLALAMGWLTFAGIRGEVDHDPHTHYSTLDEDDTEAPDQRRDDAHNRNSPSGGRA